MGICLVLPYLIGQDEDDEDQETQEYTRESCQKGQSKVKQTKATETVQKLQKSTMKKQTHKKTGKVGKRQTKAKKQNKRQLLGGSDDKWAEWQASEECNRSERKVRKERFLGQYLLDDIRRGFIVYDERRGLYPDQIEDLEDSFENAVKKERHQRRVRKINESLNWSLY